MIGMMIPSYSGALLAVLAVMPAPSLGLIGFGISMYDPTCAFACRSSIASAMLQCSNTEHAEGGGGHHGDGMTTPECRAGDTPFLTTLAYCVNSNCADFDVPAYKLEKYWFDQASGDKTVFPKWSYAEAVAQLEDPPTVELTSEDTLNFTALVNHDTWAGYFATHKHFELAETRHSTYGIILLVVGFGLPIVLTLLGKLPFMTTVMDKINPYLVYPSIVGRYHVRPLPYLLGNAPTVGHSLYIAVFLALNIIFTAAGYKTSQPNNFWFATSWEEVMGYVSARTGVLAFALAPLVFLFSGRNNFLLWVTNWSHSTYMLLHRWVARIFGVQIILHSITELVLYLHWESAADQREPYWIWGIVATLAVCIMLVISTLWFRRLSYEAFLIIHIVLAIITLIGSWYHVELLFTRKWGYELWLYACFAVWFFDRLVRVLRVLKTGMLRSTVTQVTEDIVRIDVAGVRWTAAPGNHAYAYFPTLAPLRPSENHPFSILPTPLVNRSASEKSPSSSVRGETVAADNDTEKGQLSTAVAGVKKGVDSTTAGVTIYVKKATGLTKFLSAKEGLFTLLEGPYPSNPTSAVLKCDRLLIIAGGIGITGVLSFIPYHPNVKVCWSVKQGSENLVSELNGAVSGAVDKDIRIGRRLDVVGLLTAEENAGWSRIGVVVCGPGGLCDDVRAEVAMKGKKGSVTWELEVDAFSW